VVLPEIHKTFELPANTAEAREKQAEVQGQLCGVLQVIVQKLSEEEDTKSAVLNCADQVRGRVCVCARVCVGGWVRVLGCG
jgi:importin subunit beta-1